MSISNDYANLADVVAGFCNRLEPIMPSVAKHIAANLLALADQVKHLENTPLRLDSPEVRLGFHELRRERHDAD
jgi:hypothetical protein